MLNDMQLNLTSEQKKLIYQLHLKEKKVLEAIIAAVILYKCEAYENVKIFLDNQNPDEHNFIQVADLNQCAICSQDKDKHKESEIQNEEILKLKKILQKEIESFQVCSICYEKKIPDDIVVMKGRSHNMCKYCFDIFLNFEISQGNIKLKCPHCDLKLADQDILFYSPNSFDKYQRFKREKELATIQKIVWCSDCQKHFNVINKKINQTCPLCQKNYCLKCKQKVHPNTSCTENLTTEFGFSQNTKQCPACEMMIEKIGGCNNMLCQYCNSRWCWKCAQTCSLYHSFFCIAIMPGYNSQNPPNYFKQTLWYFVWTTFLFILGFFVFQVILFEELSRKSFYELASTLKKIFLIFCCFLLSLITFPFTTLIYLILLLPLALTYFIALFSEKWSSPRPQRINNTIELVVQPPPQVQEQIQN